MFIESSSPIYELFLYIFMASILFGAVARKTCFCPLGGIADVIHSNNKGRFFMYLFAIAIAMLSVTALELFSVVSVDETRPPYRMSQFRWIAYIIGGLLFGFGMTLSRGCGMKNILNLGGGNLKAIVAILGMGSAAVLMLYVEGFFNDYFLSWVLPLSFNLSDVGIEYQDLGSLANYILGVDTATLRTVIGFLISAALILYALKNKDFMARRNNLLGGLVVGLLIPFAYFLSGGAMGEIANEASEFMDLPQNGMGTQSYTFIRPMGDLLYVISNPESYLITFGLVAFLGVGAGSLLISIATKNIQIEWFSSTSELLRYLVGGVLVGIGGILGMGCTLGQGVAGTSTLALGSFLNLASLIIGAAIGIKMQKNFMHDHEVPKEDN